MIVLITNSVAPYGFDLQQVLGLPEGLCHRFRYKDTWIDEPLRIGPKKNSKVVISLRDWDTGRIIPVRAAKLLEPQLAGEAKYFPFVLENYISDFDEKSIAEKIAEVFKLRGIENIPKNHLNTLMIDIGKYELKKQKDEVSWGSVVEKFSNIGLFKEYSFLKIEPKEINGAPLKTSAISDSITGLKLEAGRTYAFDIEQYSPNSSKSEEKINSPFNIKLNVPSSIDTIRGEQRVVGQYDVLRFLISVPKDIGEKNTECAIVAEQSGEAARYGLSAIFLPLVVSYSLHDILFVALGMALFLSIDSFLLSDFLKTTYSIELPKLLTGCAKTLGVLLMASGGGLRILKYLSSK